MDRAKAPSGKPTPDQGTRPRGLALLLRGRNGNGSVHPEHPPVPKRQRVLLKSTLVFADVLLVALAGWLVFGPNQHIGLFQIALAVVALATGAWLACVALWL